MRLVRLLSRIALLSLAAAAFAGLTGVYADSVRPDFPNPQAQAARRRRPSEPQIRQFPSLLGEGMLMALYAAAGRLAWRHLPGLSRGEEQAIMLDLRRSPEERGE